MRFIVLFICIIPLRLFAQFDIDFETGNLEDWQFSATGRWERSTESSLNGVYSLKHIFDNPGSDVDAASVSIKGLRPDLGTVSWEFKLRYGFDPSSQNNWSIVLASDKAADKGMIQNDVQSSFSLGVNLKGSDDTLRLWKSIKGSCTEVVNTNINWQNDIGTDSVVNIKVERDISGYWNVYLLNSAGIGLLVGSGRDNEFTPFYFFGIRYKYTSTRDRAIWLDDIKIEGVFVEDNLAPEILASEFISNSCLILKLNEAPSGNWKDTDNYLLSNPDIHPLNVSLEDSRSIRLDFSVKLKNKEFYTVSVDSLSDVCNNTSYNLSISTILAMPEWGDIIISEFMSDPKPVVELGGIEYLEIYNKSNYAYNLRSLSLIKGETGRLIGDYSIDPGQYIVLCDITDTASVSGCRYIGISGFPSLNNSSGYLLLCDTFSYTIHGVDYNDSWFSDNLKKEGGWSLEMIDTDYPFSGSGNWSYSKDPAGGSPGSQNSVSDLVPDLYPPEVSTIYAPDKETIIVKFSEPVQDLTANKELVEIDNINISSVAALDSLRRAYKIVPDKELNYNKQYTALFNKISDYEGNCLSNPFPVFGLFKDAMPEDIILNEVLFNSIGADEEYIEFYNRSKKVINAADLRLATVNPGSGDTSKIYCVSDEPRCILPESYYVITENPGAVLARYSTSDQSRIHRLDNMPGLDDSEAEVLLYNKSLVLLDRFYYKDSYHYDLISGTEGVSLERIDSEEPGNIAYNWHSASGMSGWGTPGLPNSVSFDTDSLSTDALFLSSGRISPDNDGFEDILKISLNTGAVTSLVNIIIYDDIGHKISHPVRNLSATGKENYYWDACDDYGSPLPGGLYIIYVRSVSANGRSKEWKKVCAVLRR